VKISFVGTILREGCLMLDHSTMSLFPKSNHFLRRSIWRSNVPLRVALLGKILTTVNLRKQHIIVVNWCCMCKMSGKFDHL